MIDVCLLGVGGTLPLPDRFLSAALVRAGGHLVLLDCGEGTQVSLRKLGWGLKDIGTLLITHFHADHVSGIPGLLLTIGNSGRTRDEPVTIVGPRGIRRIVESLRIIAPSLPYPIVYVEMTGDGTESVAAGPLTVTSCLGDHEMPCLSYRMDLARAPLFRREKAEQLPIPVQYWKHLQRGETVEYQGQTYRPEQVLGPPRPGLAFGFLTDSRPTRNLVEFHSDVDLLICEATYGDPDDQPKAIDNKHMTFTETATLAAAARAKRLWMTHFSPALPNPDYFRRNAECVYPGAVIGSEHLTITLAFPD
jgi:ribonuclease Z